MRNAMNRRRWFTAGCLLACSLFCGSVLQAGEVTLTQLYDAALNADAGYQGAESRHRASQEEEAIGRGGLLPRVGLGASYSEGGSRSQSWYRKNDYQQSQQYTNGEAALSVSQPLYDKGRWAEYQAAKARGKLGEEAYGAAGQDLYLRVAAAYFDVARLENELKLATQQKAAIAALAKQTRVLFEKGEGTITDSEEAQARLDLIAAQEVQWQASRQAALRRLAGRTALPVDGIPAMAETMPALQLSLADAGLTGWQQAAADNSPLLRMHRAAVEAARADLQLQKSGHYPTVSLNGQMARQDQKNVDGFNQQYDSHYVGISVNVPLYEGGSVSASTRRAHEMLDATQRDYDAALQQLNEDIETDYNGVVSGLEQGNALQTAVRSNQRALQSAEKGYQAGVRSAVDILDAQQRLFAARRDLLNAKLMVLQSFVSLHVHSGRMNRNVLEQVQADF